MTILNLVSSNNPILKTPTQEFDFANPPMDPAQLVKDLAETMIDKKGLGLSANQCGIPYSVFVINGNPIQGCFNPKIVNASEDIISLDEGCLSYPGLILKVKRPKNIRVRYTMANGQTVTHKFEGLTARCFLHEYDHLQGIVHLTKASLYHREKALKNQKIYNRILERSA